uniref:Cystatin domain-containing protein n=1 Tax=Pelodiscus sinensis TaxID=13735 RepID=K7GI21_PELSI
MALLLGALLVSLGVSVTANPLLEAQLSPRDVARAAVEAHNQETGTQAVFRLLKLKSFHKTQFDWGRHFSMNFTIKETNCRKSMASYRLEDCRYRPNGVTKDCSADVSVLYFLQEAPLTSVKCTQQQVSCYLARCGRGGKGRNKSPWVPLSFTLTMAGRSRIR